MVIHQLIEAHKFQKGRLSESKKFDLKNIQTKTALLLDVHKDP